MRVLVCTWDPSHTLQIAEAQQKATRGGVVVALFKECDEDIAALAKKLASRSLLTVKMVSGEPCCTRCGTPMEWLYSQDGIDEWLLAVRDVAQDFDKAFERTRRRNSGREEDEEEGSEDGDAEEGAEGDA